MPRSEIDLNPVQHITVDAIGQPGHRVFYIQGWRADDIQPVTIIIEKIQLQTLAAGLEQMLAEAAHQNPALTGPAEAYDADKMRISPPVDPLFRAGEMGLGYDTEQDLIVILVREILAEGGDPEEASVVRFWCTRQQSPHLSAVRAADGTRRPFLPEEERP
jgi:uncharacterized repeat protein (TIGR03847 family)